VAPLRGGLTARIGRAVPSNFLSTVQAEVSEHGIAEQGICTSLIAAALAAQPGNHIGVQAKGKLLPSPADKRDYERRFAKTFRLIPGCRKCRFPRQGAERAF
jgi:hypothetical protein